ncbi:MULTISPECIES: hypothetical protein [unclassified Sphingomonas]|uniref:hypothetical protein n=1 Tax=unclassified Sphingomonas TaxID=196159 RepID=UPI00226AD17B|nr:MULTISPECIES: hypothetical protein [unclassified Sphingomonas]
MSRWIILRTSGGQTVPLMKSLREAGIDAWSPARTIRRVLHRGKKSERRVEIDVPILATFVFAREEHIVTLADLASDPTSLHPAFSIFRYNGKVPLVADAEVVGLQEEEQREAATMQEIRAAETRREAEQIRIAALKSEAARRRATKELERVLLAERRAEHRAKQRTFEPGELVDVAEMPALDGVAGVVESSDRSFAMVRFGTRSWKIDGWRLMPTRLDVQAA